METSKAKIGDGPAEGVTVGLRVVSETPMYAPHRGEVVEVIPVRLVQFGRRGREMVRIGDDYRIRFDDGTETVTDLRQRMWSVEQPAPRRVSVNDVLAGRLPSDATGVWWQDTGWIECRDHLERPSWRDAVMPGDEPDGVVLTATDIECDACREREA